MISYKEYSYKIVCVVVSSILLLGGCYYFKSSASRNPKRSNYIVIGCSAAGFYAAKKLHSLDGNAQVTCISEEQSLPYNKMKLHAYVGKARSKRVELVKNSQELGFALRLGSKVVELNTANRIVRLADGTALPYDKLLMATGARPFVPDVFVPHLSSPKIRFYNSKADVDALLSYVDANPAAKIAIMGAGIRALELADGLKKRHPELAMTIFNRSARFFGEQGDEHVDEMVIERLKSAGVALQAPMTIKSITNRQHLLLKTDQGEHQVDMVVLVMGTIANSDLLKNQGVAVYNDGSIKVDSFLRTSDPHIFAAGDVAGFKNPIGDDFVRSAKWMAARKQGQIAAFNMAGKTKEYRHETAVFFSSFFGVKVVLSGAARVQPETISYIKNDGNSYQRLVVDSNRLISCALLWNKKGRRPNAFFIRKKIVDQSPITPMETRFFIDKI